MKFFLLCLSLSALLLGGAVDAWAEPPASRSESRGRLERLQTDRIETDRSTRGEETRNNREEDGKPTRMSPEQRKALRQQINEAGQDIYQPKR